MKIKESFLGGQCDMRVRDELQKDYSGSIYKYLEEDKRIKESPDKDYHCFPPKIRWHFDVRDRRDSSKS